MNGRQPKQLGPTLDFTEEFQARRQDSLFYNLLALVLAVAGTLVCYLGLSLFYHTPALESFLGQVPDSSVPWAIAVMLSRGLLQPLNFFLFSYGTTLLVMRLWLMRREFKTFNEPYFDGIPTNEEQEILIGEESRTTVLKNVREIAKGYSGTLPLLTRRIEAGSRRLADQGDANQVHAIMQAIADIDHDALESRFTLLRYLIWLIPTIGFLGTVMGIGLAIAGFTGLLGHMGNGEGDFQTQLQPVLAAMAGELGVAFDTTVLALLLSAVIVALTSIVQSREEDLLTSIDEFCLRYFVSRIVVPEFSVIQMEQAFGSIAQAIAMNLTPPAKPESQSDFSWRNLAGKFDQIAAKLDELKTVLSQTTKKSTKNDK